MVATIAEGIESFDAIDSVTDAALAHFGTSSQDGVRRYGTADVMAVDNQGLLPLLDQAIGAGRADADDPARAALRTLMASAARQAVILESRAVATVAALHVAGIHSRALKGLAVAHLDYPSPELRPFCDVDVLVAGRDIGRATEVLAAAGFRRHFAEPFAHFDERIGKGVAVEDDHGVVIDLHRTLALGYFGTRLAVDVLWDDAEEFELAGVTLHAMPRAQRFLHSALHLALSPAPTLLNCFDLAAIARRDPTLDAGQIVAAADAARSAHPVAVAVSSTIGLLGGSWVPDGLDDWAAQWRGSWTERTMMAAYRGRWARSWLRSATALAGLHGADRVLAARGLLFRDRLRLRE